MKKATMIEDGLIRASRVLLRVGEPTHNKWLAAHYNGSALIEVAQGVSPSFLDAAMERIWRNAELANADIELNKVQDGDGAGLVSDWRAYRRSLRSWPEHELFPSSDHRPTFTNTEK